MSQNEVLQEFENPNDSSNNNPQSVDFDSVRKLRERLTSMYNDPINKTHLSKIGFLWTDIDCPKSVDIQKWKTLPNN